MSTVIETLAEYETFLRYDRRIKSSTMRKINLSLKYFTELYGITETTELKASDMYIFYERMKNRRCARTKKNGERPLLGNTFVQKVMKHLKSYIKRLGNKRYAPQLFPTDVPIGKTLPKPPAFLTKEELARIMQTLEQDVINAEKGNDEHKRYSAYLRRAVVWMLYTAGLRNAELRELAHDNLDIPRLCGQIIGKGDKPGVITYSEAAQKMLLEYLHVREQYFPETTFRIVFTLYREDHSLAFTEQLLNRELKEIAQRAGVTQNVHAHLFRHTLATHLLMDGRSITDVRDKMRHDNVATTSIYTHSLPATMRSMTKSLGADLMLHA